MDRVEYNLRAEQIKDLVRNREFEAAMDVCDSVDWRRVKSLSMLCTVSEIYKANKRFEDSRDVLLMAYNRYPNNKMIVYSLCELAIKINDILQALAYLREFTSIAPKDTGRYILQYKLYTSQNVSIEERIEVLEHYKAEEYREKWAYELAYLYHSIGDATKCIEECDELILWFREGKYVEMAMELKMSHQPLTPEQQKSYERMTGIGEEYFDESEEAAYEDEAAYQDYNMPPINIKSVAPSSQRTQEIFTEDQAPDLDIKLREFNPGKDSTINIQAALSESVSDLFADHQDDSYGMQLEPVDGSQEVFYSEEQYADSDVREYQPEYAGEYMQEGYAPEYQGEYVQEGYAPEYQGEYVQEGYAPEYQDGYQIPSDEIPSDEIPSDEIPSEDDLYEEEIQNGSTAFAAATELPAEDVEEYTEEATEDDLTEDEFLEAADEEEAAEVEAIEEDEASDETEEDVEDATETAEESADSVDDIEEEVETAEEVQPEPVRPVVPKAVKKPIDPSIKPIIPRKRTAARQDMGMEAAGKSMSFVSPSPALESMGKSMPSAGTGVSRDTIGMSHILSQEYDGQISMVVPEPDPIEKQITGQIDISQYLKEWEQMRQQNTRSRIDAAKRKSMEQTSDIMSQLEGVLPGVSTKLPPIEEISRGMQAKKAEEKPAVFVAEEEPVPEETILPDEEEDIFVEESRPAKTLVSQNTGILDDIPMGETGTLPSIEDDEELYEDEDYTSDEEAYEDEAEYSEDDEYFEDEDYAEEEYESDEDAEEYSEDEDDYAEDGDEYSEEDDYAEEDEYPDEGGEGDSDDEYAEDDTDDEEDSDEVEETVDLSDDEDSPNVYEDLSEDDEEDEEDTAEEDVQSYASEDDELEEFFGEFLQMKKMRGKIKDALAASDMTAVINNIVITGNEKSARLKLALAIARSKQKSEPDFKGKVAKVSAKVLNTKDVKKAVASLAGGAMIIEGAGDLDPNTLERLARSLNHRSSRMLVIMEDEYEKIRNLSMTKPYFSKMFNVSLKMSAFKNDDLVAHAKAYALEQEYVIDDLAVLALYTRIDDLQTHNHFVTLAEVEGIIDEAIDNANRKSFSHFKDVLFAKRYDENDMVILREKDFEV